MDPNRPNTESDNIENKERVDALSPFIDPAQTDPMPRKSRLSKSFQKKSRNTLVLSILAIAAILFLLFRYGLPLISDASFLFGRVTSTQDSKEENIEKEAFVPVPNLDGLPKATSEEFVRVGGMSMEGLTVEVYLNGKKVDNVIAGANGDFETKVTLSEGENIIKAKAIKGDSESDFSESLTISLIKEGPELSIDTPTDGSEIKNPNPYEIRGKTDPDTNVLVNDFQAIVNSAGEWSYFLTLKDGDNEIKAVATDAAGNETEKVIHVKYSP